MRFISTNQKQSLEKAKRTPRPSPSEIAMLLQDVIGKKQKTESLDPQWIGIWEQNKDGASIYLPPSHLRQIDEAVSIIDVIDAEAWEVRIAEDEHPTILLGAGASAPPPSNIPTVANLLPELWHRAKRIGSSEIDRLAEWCQARGIRNIEDLLTAAYISNFAAKNANVSDLLDYFLFGRAQNVEEEEATRRIMRHRSTSDVNASSIALLQETLQTLFGLLTGTMIRAKPNSVHLALAQFMVKRPSTRIVTTNYDGCMDEALLDEGRSLDGIAGTGRSGQETDSIELVKMHGSINWSYCDSCQEVRDFPLRLLKNGFENDTFSYAVIGICKRCGGTRRPLLVPPLSLKFMTFPNLVGLWHSARRAIESASVIVSVGYSFSEADTYLTRMISRSMSLKPAQRLIVCDINTALVPLLRQRFSAHIEDFDEARVIMLGGSCKTTVPDLLNSLIAAKDVEQGVDKVDGAATVKTKSAPGKTEGESMAAPSAWSVGPISEISPASALQSPADTNQQATDCRRGSGPTEIAKRPGRDSRNVAT